MAEHRRDDGLAAIRGPCGIRADPKARASVVETEASETQEFLEFEHMLAARLRPAGLFAEQRQLGTDLLRDEGEHRQGWASVGSITRPGCRRRQKLDGEAESVAGAPPGADNGQIGDVEHVMLSHGGCIGRDREQPGSLLGCARVSKGDEQNNALQTKALKAAGCKRPFEETASGGRWDRPEPHRLLDHLREGDTVVVWKLDRLSRSLKDVLHIMERIDNAGAGFRSITENIDTTTPAGRMMTQMVGAFAEFERAMIRERTSSGLAAARAEGRIGGRRKKCDDTKRREIAESVVSGRKSAADMARLYGVSQPTVSRIVAAHVSDQV